MGKGEFGDLIRSSRERLGMKAFEMADVLGMHGSQVSRLENGDFKETPSPQVLRALSDTLGVSVARMLDAIGYDLTLPANAITDPALAEIVAGWGALTPELRAAVRQIVAESVKRAA